jgi:hypothetical protein
MCGSIWQAKMKVAKPVVQAQPPSFNEAASVQDAELRSNPAMSPGAFISSMRPHVQPPGKVASEQLTRTSSMHYRNKYHGKHGKEDKATEWIFVGHEQYYS